MDVTHSASSLSTPPPVPSSFSWELLPPAARPQEKGESEFYPTLPPPPHSFKPTITATGSQLNGLEASGGTGSRLGMGVNLVAYSLVGTGGRFQPIKLGNAMQSRPCNRVNLLSGTSHASLILMTFNLFSTSLYIFFLSLHLDLSMWV